MLSPPTLIKVTSTTTSFFVLLTTSNMTNTMIVNRAITASENWVTNCARNTICPSLFPAGSVERNTMNGRRMKTEPPQNHRSEKTSISASSQFPLTRNFCFWWEPKVMKSKGKLLRKELPNISHSDLRIKTVLCVAAWNLLGENAPKSALKNA